MTQQVSVSVTVPARSANPGQVLPFTGLDASLALLIAVLLLFVGVLLLKVRKRPKGEME